MSLQGEQLATPVPGDFDVEQALLALADGSYVLSTPDGVVAECGLGVVALLGETAEQLTGRRVADVLASAADPATRAAFDRTLAGSRGNLAFPTATAGGVVRSLRLHVVCVPLALGWEFTSLLGELGSRDADTWHPEALRLRHERALEAIESVCMTGAQPDPGARLAGILIVVGDADAPPLTREDVATRMAEQRAAARAVAEQARREALGLSGHRASDAGGPSAGGLEDLVERAHLLRERVEEAEREAADALAGRQRALARLAAAEARLEVEHEQAEARVAAALDGLAAERAQLAAARQELDARRDGAQTRAAAAEAERERVRAQLAESQAERDRVLLALEAAQAELAQAVARLAEAEGRRDAEAQRRAEAEARAAAMRETGDGRVAQIAGERDDALAAVATAEADLDVARAAAAAAREQAEAAETAAEAARAVARSAHDDVAAARAETLAARDEAATLRAELEAARHELEAERAAAGEVKAEREKARERASQLLCEAESARAAAEAIRAEFSFEAPPRTHASPARSAPAPDASTPLGKPTRDAPAKPVGEPEAGTPELPSCEPGHAAALIGLDGTFERLDDAFCLLLGCREDELRAARWPSIIDRDNLDAHRELARALRAGEVDSADIETIYMHAGGLLVPIEGTVSMLRDDAGEPSHYLFRADVRRTAGASRP